MEVEYEISEIENVAKQIISEATKKVILFNGAMGAGKTTLIKTMVKVLGATDIASSPTFSLVNEYETPKDNIFHFDFYRIEDEQEALDIGIEDYFAQDHWIFIEWPQKISSFLPPEYHIIDIVLKDETKRILKFS